MRPLTNNHRGWSPARVRKGSGRPTARTRPTVRAGAGYGRWWWTEDPERRSERTPVFLSDDAAAGDRAIVDRSFVSLLTEEADRRFAGLGARVEYCRARGVDYERSVRYLPVVAGLVAALALVPAGDDGGNPVDAQVPAPPVPKLLRRPVWVPPPPPALAPLPSDAQSQWPPLLQSPSAAWWLENLANCVQVRSEAAGGSAAKVMIELHGRPHLRVYVSGTTRVAFLRLVRDGCCPLCGAQPAHHPAVCPQLPPDLRGMLDDGPAADA